MRGKVTFASALHKGHRITPAYAGKSFRPIWGVEKTPDHPRMCGEKILFLVGVRYPLGSPPHVRGKGELSRAGASTSRITPAYAGKSLGFCTCVPWFRDHPRVCGEKAAFHRLHLVRLGSPPRMRGKGIQKRDGRVRVGITPACAGKSG